jgi:HSP90 family molecular chaperone
LAESSPYFEALKQKDVEVLFCYEPYDELVLMQLRQFDSHNLTSVEKEMREDKEPDDLTDLGKYTDGKCSNSQGAETFKIFFTLMKYQKTNIL